MRIMYDTNLFISALLYPDSALACNLFEGAERFSLVVSSQILEEFRTVMKRKFPDKIKESETMLRRLRYWPMWMFLSAETRILMMLWWNGRKS